MGDEWIFLGDTAYNLAIAQRVMFSRDGTAHFFYAPDQSYAVDAASAQTLRRALEERSPVRQTGPSTLPTIAGVPMRTRNDE